MIFKPGLRRFALTAHVGTSAGLVGGVLAFLVLAVIGLIHAEPDVARSMYVAMDRIAVLVVLPLCIGALATGLIQSLGTAWGVIRYYWVVAKLVLTAATIAILVTQLPGLNHLAAMAEARTMLMGDLDMLRLSAAVHATGGLAVILTILALSIYKPGGLTAYGRRRRAS